MLDIKFNSLANFELGLNTHVGNLETIVWLDSNELSSEAKQAILNILEKELQNIPTSELLKKLA